MRPDLLLSTANESFRDNILQKFADDEEGKLCRKDEILQIIGKNLWSKERKTDKSTEVTKSVMNNMHRLASLFINFLNEQHKENTGLQPEFQNIGKMFNRTHFPALERAIEKMCNQEKELKAGLKLGLRYLIQNAADILKGHYLIRNCDESAKEIDTFISVFKLKRYYIFGDAEYKIKKDRQVRLRNPEELPNEDDLHKINFIQLTESQHSLETPISCTTNLTL